MKRIKTKDFPATEYSWKVMSYDDMDKAWKTPWYANHPKNNRLKATGKVGIVDNHDNYLWEIKSRKLEGGAIHCYRTKQDAKVATKYYYSCREIFKVKGKKPVAYNDTEIAFKEVEFVDTINDWEI